MPAGQPFTALCQFAARGRAAGRADLHVHTTCSDGTYTPAEVVDLARRAGLSAVALTDHDTLAAVPAARLATKGTALEVVAGVEITTEYRQREMHLLAFFVCPEHAGLRAALEGIRRHRAERFREMIERLRRRGVSLQGQERHLPGRPEALGRRHLAEMLVRSRHVGTVREAFRRYLGDRSEVNVPKKRLPVAEALALVRDAGGVAAWAHPPYDCDRDNLAELRHLGMAAVEVEFPDVRRSRTLELRAWAAELGLAVTGGSDCHGPGRRCVGTCTVSAAELDRLRQMKGMRDEA
jgi:predicted metal-dependent phosphoesterase TrpH